VDVLEIKPGCMPMAFGVLRPAILMPADAHDWSEEKQRIVMLHELAHVRRGDAATHLLARAATAVYWWNPLAWMAWREFLKEGERAADDLVLNTGARASEYAGHLLEIARTMQGSPVMAWAAPAIARRSQLEGRLLSILDSSVNRAAPSRASVLAAATLAVAMIAPLAALRAQAPLSEAIPSDVDAAIRAAQSQKNYETLDAAARAATRRGKYESAQKLLESALAIRAEVSGAQSVEYGVGLVKLAELEQKRDPKTGGDLYAKAAQILGEKPEAAPALTHLGFAALDKHDFAQAFEYFQRAQQVAPAEAGTSLMWMAVVRQTEKNMTEAEFLYRNALAAAEPKSADAAVIMEVFAQFLREQGRTEEAKDFSARAAAIQGAGNGTPPALPDDVFSVGRGVSAPVPLKKQEPNYSVEARAARLQGSVVIQVAIGTDGLAHGARVLRGVGLGLDENAIEAVSQWQFKPGMKDGQPVKVKATIEVNFRLL
jgi:TonB family protein